MYLQLAWRNLWRNRKRTTVILVAILIGVWSMIVLSAFAQGMLEGSVENAISTLTGHLQVHQKNFRDDPVIEHRMKQPEEVKKALQKTLPEGSAWSPRVRISGIVNNARYSSGVTIIGMEPEKEAAVSFIGRDAVIAGEYLSKDDRQGILVGQTFIENMETKLDRKVVVMTEDSEGEIASRAFTIKGIFRAEMENTEKRYVFVSKTAALEMLKLENALTEVAVLLPDREKAEPTAEALRQALPEETYSIDTWKQLLPLMRAYLNIFEGYLYLMYVVVFIAMGFGIVNTILMAVLERVREFGLFNALGMKARTIVKEVMLESFFLLVVGMILGNLIGFLSIYIWSLYGLDLTAFAEGSQFMGMTRVIYPRLELRDLAVANSVVLVLGLIVSLYPAIKATRFSPVETLTRL